LAPSIEKTYGKCLYTYPADDAMSIFSVFYSAAYSEFFIHMSKVVKTLIFAISSLKTLEAIHKLIAYIENPETPEADREKAISELNLLGKPSAEIEEVAYNHWQEYFAENIEVILTQRLVIISHLLPDDVVNQCFENSFIEYREKLKQMGIDNIQKFGFTGF
jgi:hypothetical protein